MLSSSPLASSSSRRADAQHSAAFHAVQHLAPAEVHREVSLRVQRPVHWHAAQPFVRSSASGLTPPQVAKSSVISHVGQLIGEAHRDADKRDMGPLTTPLPLFTRWMSSRLGHSSRTRTSLKTHVEATQHWQRVADNKRWARISPVAPDEALAAIDDLGQKLWSSTKQRIFCEYNWYPAAIRFDQDGTMHASPDHSATGYHAWFEPLARIEYTARGQMDSAHQLLDAYQAERTDVPSDEKTTWSLQLMRCRALMDLLYVGYFVPKAYPMSQERRGFVEQGQVLRLHAVLQRFQADYAWLQARGDVSVTVRVHKPLERRTA